MPDLEGFSYPDEFTVDEESATPTYAKFVTEPWENGFGHTVGNALRRVLLSSIEGVAVASVRVDGVPHEFTHIEGVIEDMTEIVLNLKRLHLTSEGEFPRTLELTADEPGPVTAGAVKEDGLTTVLNPDLLICTLAEGAPPLRMEIEITKGRGYRPAEENKREDHPIGVIPIDCLFSPVERVCYDVQACRVGQRTDYDSLEMEVWTDGRVDPVEAVKRSAGLLRDLFGVFVGIEEEEDPLSKIGSAEDRELYKKLLVDVAELELSVRAANCLEAAEIKTVGQLIEKSDNEMLKYRNFGKKSLQEIKDRLIERELSLGMAVKEEVWEAFQQELANREEQEEDQ